MEATIEYQEVEFDVEYDHQPYEPMERYHSDGSGYPGCEESIQICSIYYEKRDMTEYFDDVMDEFEELVYEDRQYYYDWEP